MFTIPLSATSNKIKLLLLLAPTKPTPSLRLLALLEIGELTLCKCQIEEQRFAFNRLEFRRKRNKVLVLGKSVVKAVELGKNRRCALKNKMMSASEKQENN